MVRLEKVVVVVVVLMVVLAGWCRTAVCLLY